MHGSRGGCLGSRFEPNPRFPVLRTTFDPYRMTRRAAVLLVTLLSPITAAPSLAQGSATRLLGVPAPGYADSTLTADAPEPFTSAADSAAWLRDRERAVGAASQRLVVSIRERRFWHMNGPTVLRTGPVAVGKGTRLTYGDAVWEFTTPRGIRRVLRKAANPVWIPPDWHYVELAQDSSWTLVPLRHGPGVRLPDGGRVAVRGDRIVHVSPSGATEVIPPTEEIIFGDTLFMPPHGTANRRVEGELGAYKLELGDGYMLHGTPYQGSLGRAATHGCIRLSDEDIDYLFHTVRVGTPVHLF